MKGHGVRGECCSPWSQDPAEPFDHAGAMNDVITGTYLFGHPRRAAQEGATGADE